MAWQIDKRLAPFVLVTEVDQGVFFIGGLFQRKFGAAPPDFGHHIVAFYRSGDGTFAPASYLHLWKQDTIGLVGGGCTDGRVLRAMTTNELSLVNQAGGLLLQTLGYCFTKFEPQIEAFFGHCGDARAKEVDLRAGFMETPLPHLLVRHNRPLAMERQQELLRQAQAIGTF